VLVASEYRGFVGRLAVAPDCWAIIAPLIIRQARSSQQAIRPVVEQYGGCVVTAGPPSRVSALLRLALL
jgi:hypothetical protein